MGSTRHLTDTEVPNVNAIQDTMIVVLHDLDGKARHVAVQYKAFGFLDISITNNGRILTGAFYDSSDGTIKDHLTVTK